MDEVNLAVDVPALATAAEPVAAEPVRDAMLSGRFVGNRDASLADSVTEFLGAPSRDAIDLWFGAARGARLRIDHQALRDAIDRDIAAIDAMLSEQLDAILHHRRLRKLEGTWRGLAWLAGGVELSSRLKIKILNVGWAEICRDLDRAIEFDQSQMFRKIYEEEFGTPGGEPYGLLVVDHEVRHRPNAEFRTDDVSALASLSGVAAAAFSPLMIGASPGLLEVDWFADLATSTDVAAPLRNADHVRWRSLASRADMRFVGVALPRVLARPPWQDDGTRDDGFRYREYAPTTQERVWMNAGFAFAAVAARAFAHYGWPADVRGVETDRVGGGLVTDLPLEPFSTDPERLDAQFRRDRADRAAGACAAGCRPDAAFLGAVQRGTGVRRGAQPAGAAALSGSQCRRGGGQRAAVHADQLDPVRVALRASSEDEGPPHGRLVQDRGRDRALPADLADAIRQRQSVGTGESRARFPLVAGKVTVSELPGRPGSFGCVVHLQPHYQLDDISAAFQLVTDLSGR